MRIFNRFRFLYPILLGLGIAAAAPALSADTIAVIGTGRVATALGPAFAKLGHTIIYGSRDPARAEVRDLVAKTPGQASANNQAAAAAKGDIVLLAVPWSAAETVVKSLGDLSGKIIIDPTNPYARRPGGGADHLLNYQTSAGELIQGWAPGAHVVKAFNTLSSATMANPASANGPVTIPLVGNDAAANAKVAALVEGIGFHAIDLGPIRYANVVEGMLVLWANARGAGYPFEYYLRPAN